MNALGFVKQNIEWLQKIKAISLMKLNVVTAKQFNSLNENRHQNRDQVNTKDLSKIGIKRKLLIGKAG